MGVFFPKMDEKYEDGDREYNWWDCSNKAWICIDSEGSFYFLIFFLSKKDPAVNIAL